MLNKYPDVLTVREVAEVLGIGINKAYELMNLRIVGSIRIGRKIVVPKVCLIDYMESARYNVTM